VKSVLQSLGGENVTIVPRSKDQGADVTALFTVADTFSFTVAAQAKHFEEDPPVQPKHVDQLREGMDAEGATLGWLVTSGTFSEKTEKRRNEIEDETRYDIQLVDGEQLAALIVDGGLRAASLVEDE